MAAPNAAGLERLADCMTADQVQVRLPGTAEAVRAALDALMHGPFIAHCPDDLAVNVEIVLAEVMNNIVEHAYATVSGEICLKLDRGRFGIACELTDSGAAMPGLTLPKGAFQELGAIDDLPEGGFGWFLIRSLVEGLEYQRANGENRVSFRMVQEQ